jgi:hypothetical protein
MLANILIQTSRLPGIINQTLSTAYLISFEPDKKKRYKKYSSRKMSACIL